MDLMHLKHFGKQYRDVRFNVRNQFFNKLFGYLNRIDSTKFETKYTIAKSFEKDDVFNGLNVLLYSSSRPKRLYRSTNSFTLGFESKFSSPHATSRPIFDVTYLWPFHFPPGYISRF